MLSCLSHRMAPVIPERLRLPASAFLCPPLQCARAPLAVVTPRSYIPNAPWPVFLTLPKPRTEATEIHTCGRPFYSLLIFPFTFVASRSPCTLLAKLLQTPVSLTANAFRVRTDARGSPTGALSTPPLVLRSLPCNDSTSLARRNQTDTPVRSPDLRGGQSPVRSP